MISPLIHHAVLCLSPPPSFSLHFSSIGSKIKVADVVGTGGDENLSIFTLTVLQHNIYRALVRLQICVWASPHPSSSSPTSSLQLAL